MSELLNLAADVVARAKKLGAEEVSASVGTATQVSLSRREGKVEQATEATTRRLSVALLVDDRWSTHSTSDLRPDSLDHFLTRAVAATRWLEPDADRRLPDGALCGRAVSDDVLDPMDPALFTRTAAERAALASAMEAAMEAHRDDSFVSHTSYVSEGWSRSVQVMSNGFAEETSSGGFGYGAELSLVEPDGRRPEESAYFSGRYLSDLPSPDEVAAECIKRCFQRRASGPTASGTYPMLILNRVAGRILGTLAGPMSGGALHHGRSCLAGKLGQKIGSELLDIVDDPFIPRGLASQAWDGDAMRSRRRHVIEKGVLKEYYLSTYHARKLQMEVSGGDRTAWVLPTGPRSWQEIAKDLDKAILVTGFLGGNANSTTGDFSFGIQGLLLEKGEVVQSLSEMNVGGNTLEIFHKLAEAANDPWAWSGSRIPTLLFQDVSFSGRD
jgi:PmbA protein